MADQKPTFEELLLEHGLLKPAQLEHVQRRAAEQNKSLTDIIRDEQLVYPEPLAQLKAAFLGLPYVDLKVVDIDDGAMRGISERAATAYQFIAFGQRGGRLQIAMASPDNHQALEAVRFIAKKSSLTPEIYCASPENIEAALRVPPQENIKQTLLDFGREVRRAEDMPKDKAKLHQALVKAPVNKIVAVIIRLGIEGLASNIHIEPGDKEFRVRYRINEQLHTTLLLPMNLLSSVTARVKILANMRVAPARLPQAGRFVLSLDQQTYSIHVSIMPTVTGEQITLRLINTSRPAPSLTELGLASQQLDLVRKHLSAPHGLIVIAGPANSGKSTTLFAALSFLNTPAVNIATLEDPVEYEIPGVNQTPLQPLQGLTAAAALQNLLHHDVDIIMLDKLIEGTTAGLAVKAAASRLVLLAVSASDAADIIPYLASLGLNPHLIASSLHLLIAERLVPKLCQSCARPVAIPSELKEKIQTELKNISKFYSQPLPPSRKLSFSVSTGCPNCRERRSRGQIGLFEVVPLFQELRTAIANNNGYDKLVSIIRRKGYLSLYQDGLLKALAGLVNYEDVVSAASPQNVVE